MHGQIPDGTLGKNLGNIVSDDLLSLAVYERETGVGRR